MATLFHLDGYEKPPKDQRLSPILYIRLIKTIVYSSQQQLV